MVLLVEMVQNSNFLEDISDQQRRQLVPTQHLPTSTPVCNLLSTTDADEWPGLHEGVKNICTEQAGWEKVQGEALLAEETA